MDRAGAAQPGCTPIRALTIRTCGPGCVPRGSRPGPPAAAWTSEKLGRHRWVVERSLAWLTGYRRLTIRRERSARLFTAFLTPATAVTCYKNLAT
jgi:transposase